MCRLFLCLLVNFYMLISVMIMRGCSVHWCMNSPFLGSLRICARLSTPSGTKFIARCWPEISLFIKLMLTYAQISFSCTLPHYRLNQRFHWGLDLQNHPLHHHSPSLRHQRAQYFLHFCYAQQLP